MEEKKSDKYLDTIPKESDHHIFKLAALLLLLYLRPSKLILLNYKSATVSWKGQISNKCQIRERFLSSAAFEHPHRKCKGLITPS